MQVFLVCRHIPKYTMKKKLMGLIFYEELHDLYFSKLRLSRSRCNNNIGTYTYMKSAFELYIGAYHKTY